MLSRSKLRISDKGTAAPEYESEAPRVLAIDDRLDLQTMSQEVDALDGSRV